VINLADPTTLIAVTIALLLGGTLKGAIGMGSPVIAVPVMASFFDVRLAVVIMVIPNLLTNLWQLYNFRNDQLPGGLKWVFATAGCIGALLGTMMLANFPAEVLIIIVATAVFLYIGLRLFAPTLTLAQPLATQLAGPFGILAGVLQGAAGISAPISVSFLNAMHLSRAAFIPTISLFFVGMSFVQIPMMVHSGLMTQQLLILGIAALVPLLVGMPIGSFLTRSISPEAFDRVILVVLALLALKLLIDAVF